MNLLQQEHETYRDMWAVGSYADHSPGEMYLPMFLDMIKGRNLANIYVLDAGTGSGKGMIALEKTGFRHIKGCDFTLEGLVPEARKFDVEECCLWDEGVDVVDYVYCCDVLEHVPPQFTMLVVSQLLQRIDPHDDCLDDNWQDEGAAFFSVSFQPDVMGAWVGRALHQTVRPFTWWRDSLAAVGDLVECRDLLHSGVFLVKPK